ncbi:MAG: hypothetical protein P9E24_15335 [Candidatus Competibacter sp.]|nr:hypothetical protein [Candidatus Competibacter sp.]MDG4582997.1 hypothetical protein [Candidatus Competibacter sp.]
MKLLRIWASSALSGMLAAGCATLESESPPPVGQAVLEARLTALDTRLAALERRIVEQRREQWLALDQSLAEVGRDIQGARKSVAALRRKVEKPAAAARPASAATDPIWKAYQPIDVPLGGFPEGGGKQAVYPIPVTVPDSAREILLYAQVATGYVEGGPHRFRVTTMLDDGREVSFYLYATGQSQGGWGYNSDNVWLPMPKNRQLILQAEGKPFFGEWNSEVRIIAYR